MPDNPTSIDSTVNTAERSHYVSDIERYTLTVYSEDEYKRLFPNDYDRKSLPRTVAYHSLPDDTRGSQEERDLCYKDLIDHSIEIKPAWRGAITLYRQKNTSLSNLQSIFRRTWDSEHGEWTDHPVVTLAKGLRYIRSEVIPTNDTQYPAAWGRLLFFSGMHSVKIAIGKDKDFTPEIESEFGTFQLAKSGFSTRSMGIYKMSWGGVPEHKLRQWQQDDSMPSIEELTKEDKVKALPIRNHLTANDLAIIGSINGNADINLVSDPSADNVVTKDRTLSAYGREIASAMISKQYELHISGKKGQGERYVSVGAAMNTDSVGAGKGTRYGIPELLRGLELYVNEKGLMSETGEVRYPRQESLYFGHDTKSSLREDQVAVITREDLKDGQWVGIREENMKSWHRVPS